MKKLFLSAVTMFLMQPVFADEGMWTFDNFPSNDVAKKYGFSATKEWLDHVRLSSVRLAGGCSGSIVSPNGLVMTNHHCAHSCIQQLSTADKDFVADGFYAKTSADEVRCPEIEINQLIDIIDVTDRIRNATNGLADEKYNAAQKAEMSKIENECTSGASNIRCDVVTLYQGGAYHLYKYRRYQDVRLVFAPEFAIAFFGGDPDNFEFPRYDLDLSLLRIYENDQPLKADHYFKWSKGDMKEGDLTFVTGHPGGTARLLTVAQLEHQKNFSLQRRYNLLSTYREMLIEFMNKGAEFKRIANDDFFYVENSLKVYKGRIKALSGSNIIADKTVIENELRAKVNADPALKAQFGGAWDAIASALANYRNEMYKPYEMIEQFMAGYSELYGFARTLVRAAVEIPKPNGERYREFADSNLPAVKQKLSSTAPIYKELEKASFTFYIKRVFDELGKDSQIIRDIFGDKTPSEIANYLITNTTLNDANVRMKLYEGGEEAIDASTDPMIVFAKTVDEIARPIRKNYEDKVEAVVKKNAELAAKAQFAANGMNTYPDATFTLRLSYGQMKGWFENGQNVRPYTTIAGTFNHATGVEPFKLPDSWINSMEKLDANTPMNFCSTNDIIGGNSGSPVINKDAEIVGLVFDGNIHSIGGNYGYDGTLNRAVSVHSAAITETLSNIYGADRIVSELQNK
ncbi:MAG: S46 family peptidase [Pseudomonadota bacterium]